MLTFSFTISHEPRRSIWEECFPFFPFHGYHAKISEMPMGFVGSFPTQHNHLPSAFNTKEGCRDGSSTGVARKHGSSTRAARVAWWVRNLKQPWVETTNRCYLLQKLMGKMEKTCFFFGEVSVGEIKCEIMMICRICDVYMLLLLFAPIVSI